MPERMMPGPIPEGAELREALCIHTHKIYDSCQSKDCIDDTRLYPTANSQEILNQAVNVKAGGAELLYIDMDVQPVGFNRGFYTIDLRYFYRVTADAFVGGARAIPVYGLSMFDKRAILFGSEGSAKVFRSDTVPEDLSPGGPGCGQLPLGVVEAVDPVLLSVRLVESGGIQPGEGTVTEVPAIVQAAFDSPLTFGETPRKVYVSLGQFSILRLERDTQLLAPMYDYCMPEKECACGVCEDAPCDIFQQVQFPVDQFFPPNAARELDPLRALRGGR